MLNKGFTLLEVLVALVIVALTFTAFFSSVSAINRNQSIIIEKSYALWAAESILSQVELGLIQRPKIGKSINSTIMMGHNKLHYRMTTIPTTDINTVKYEVVISNAQGHKAFTLIGFGNIS